MNDKLKRNYKIGSHIFFFAAICMIITGIINSTKGEGFDITSFSVGGTFVCCGIAFNLLSKKDNK